MPIVVNYTDLEALGTLATQAGRAQGQAQAAAMDQQAELQRQQMQAQERAAMRSNAVDRYGIDQQRAAGVDELRARQLEQERRIGAEMQELATRGEQSQAELARKQAFEREEAETEARRRRDREMEVNQLRQQGAYDRAAMTSGTRIETARIAADARMATAGMRGGNAENLFRMGGAQSSKYAEGEALKLAHMLPVPTNRSAAGMSMAGERAIEYAQNLSRLPTTQLMSWAEENVNDPYYPYVSAVIADRQRMRGQMRRAQRQGIGSVGGAGGGGEVAPQSPGNRSLFSGGGAGGPVSSTGNGYGEPAAGRVTRRGGGPIVGETGFEGLSDQELYDQLQLSPGMTADEILDDLLRDQ